VYFSLAIHPDKVKIATGQVAGHDRKDSKVRNSRYLFEDISQSRIPLLL
jgi:hypothetical protein